MFIHSPNELDPRSITMLGLSAKPGENAIGMFGTGLKYSLAWLLRNGVVFSLRLNGEPQHFEMRTEEFRGQSHDFLYLNGERLPFTANYARNWKAWQVYRELVANAMDEGGGVSKAEVSAPVVFHIPSFAEIEHHSVFLDRNLPCLYRDSDVEIYDAPSIVQYYRGIRCTEPNEILPVTFNWLCDIGLSEDRLMTTDYHSKFNLAWAIANTMSEPALRAVFKLKDEWFSRLPTIECHNDTLKAMARSALPPVVREWLRAQEPKTFDYEDVKLSGLEEMIYQQALQIVELRYEVPAHRIVKNLPADIKGIYNRANGEILIAYRNVSDGPIELAATLMEEIIHKETGFGDLSFRMQNYLIRALAEEMGKRL